MINLINQKFGKLTVIEYDGLNKHNVCLWKCKCECGNIKVIISQSLRNGNTKSCGCLLKKKNKIEHLRKRENVPIICGIYKIINPIGEVYIGGSRTIYRRWLRHREARKKLKIHLSIKNYGWKNHIFEIVHELPQDISNETLLVYEQLYIDLYKYANCKMLNVKDAGSSAKFSEESKLKMSLSQKKEYKLMLNGELIVFNGLKEYCLKNNLGEKQLSEVYNNNGHYGKKNYYRGYSRIN